MLEEIFNSPMATLLKIILSIITPSNTWFIGKEICTKDNILGKNSVLSQN